MKKSLKYVPQNRKQQNKNDGPLLKHSLICFRNIVDSILKRIQFQAINKIRQASFEIQNKELKQRINNMQMQAKDLQEQKCKLEQNTKRLQRSRLFLPPRRPNISQKDLSQSRSTELLKRYQQNQARMQNQIDQLTNQIAKFSDIQKTMHEYREKYMVLKEDNAKLALDFEKIKSEMDAMTYSRSSNKSIYQTPRALLSQNSQSKSSCDDDRQRLKELQDFLVVYEAIRSKKNQNISYERQMNELRIAYPDSVLLQMIQNQLVLQFNHQTILTSIKSIISLFTQNEWKRRPNILLKQQGQVFACINQIITLLLNLSKDKEQLTKSVNEIQMLRRKCRILSEQNAQIKEDIKQFRAQYKRINELNSKMNVQIQSRAQIQQPQSESSSSLTNTKQNQSIQSQLAQAYLTIQYLNDQIQKIKEELYQAKLTNINISKNTQNSKQQVIFKIERSKSYSPKQVNLTESRAKVENLQQKVANYKILFEKIKMERDNLKLLLQQKNQQYQISKESEERYEQLKQKDQQTINNLKLECRKTELQNIRLTLQIEKIMKQSQLLQADYLNLQCKANESVALKNKQQQQLVSILKNQQQIIIVRQAQLQQLRMHYQTDITHFQQENNMLRDTIQTIQQQTHNIIVNLEQQLRQQRLQCDNFNRQIQQSKQLFQKQRQTFREKINQHSKTSETFIISHLTQNKERQQLRQQLQSMNAQLAITIRNCQNQKRQNRRYIEQLLDDIQSKNTLYNEDKRMLKEQIERVRSQEYQINQDKIKKLREDIQALRSENERLISIIDSNEAPFNQLVQQHRQLCEENCALQELNNNLSANLAQLQGQRQSLEQIFVATQTQKLSLIDQLRFLEQKVEECQVKIKTMISNEQIKDSRNHLLHQQMINKFTKELNHFKKQNELLNAKDVQLSKQIVQLQNHLIHLQSEANIMKELEKKNSSTIEQKQNLYSQYLQEQLHMKEAEVKQHTQTENELLSKIESQITTIKEYQCQRQNLLKFMNEKENQNNIRINQFQTQFISMNQAILQLRSIINSKEIQIKRLHQDSNPIHSIAVLQNQVVQRETKLIMSLNQNNKLKQVIELNKQQLSQLAHCLEENKAIKMENKRLVGKIAMIESSFKEISQTYLQVQSDNTSLKVKIQQSYLASSSNINQHPIAQNVAERMIRQELEWYKQQLRIKDNQVNQSRAFTIDLQRKLSQIERQTTELIMREQKYLIQMNDHQQMKVKQRELQNLLYKMKIEKDIEHNKVVIQLNDKQQEIGRLQLRINQLGQKIKKSNDKLSSFKKQEKKVLLHIAKQLDENYKVDDQEEEMYVKILQKISQQVSSLIEINHSFQQKGQLLQKQYYQSSIQEMQGNLSLLLSHTIHNFISYLSANHFINPQEVPSLPKETDIEQLIFNFGQMLKGLFANCIKNTQDEIGKYNNIIRDIRVLIEEAYSSKSIQTLSNLLILLHQTD